MQRKKGVILSYILMLFEVLSTLLLTPLIIRTLGQAEYGVYRLAVSITGYLLLLDLGIGNSVIRYIAKYRATNDHVSECKFLGVSIIYYIIVALFSGIVGWLLIIFFPIIFSTGLSVFEVELGKKLLIITILNIIITLTTTVFNNVIIAYEKFGVSKGFSIFQIACVFFLPSFY